MPIRRYKPTSAGRRFMTVSTFEEVTKSKPKRRGQISGRKPGWKKAIVQLRPGDSIEIFEGVHA